MTHSPFPWSEGVSYVFDSNAKVVCREPLLPELEGGHWNDNRKLIAAVPAMIEALEKLANAESLQDVRSIVAGWNGERRASPYQHRHPRELGATLPKTTCGAVYDLDDALQTARAVLTSIGRTK